MTGPARRSRATEGTGDQISVNTRIYELVKERILANRFSAGYKLNHQELAELFNVSRTPIREALERLYQEGFVAHYPNRGFFVAQIDENEARELFEVREGLESHALRVCFERDQKYDLRRTRQINKEYRVALKSDHSRHRMSLDRDFHLSLAAHTGNDYLLRSLESIFDRIMLKFRVETYPGHSSRAHHEHEEILQAISKGDAKKAESLLSVHIRKGFDRLRDQL